MTSRGKPGSKSEGGRSVVGGSESQSRNGKAVRLPDEVGGVRDEAESGLAGAASVGATSRVSREQPRSRWLWWSPAPGEAS